MLEQKLIYIIVNGGLPLIFFLLFLEAIPFIGTIVPGQFLVLLIGVLIATTHVYPLSLVFLVIFLGAYLGDLGGFLLGKKLGELGLKKYGFKKESIFYKKSQTFFNKFGLYSIIMGRELNVTRAFLPFIAGLSNMKTKTFLIVSFFSVLLWVSLSLFLGYTFGFFLVEKIIFMFEFIGVLVVYLIIITIIFLSYKSFHKKNYALFKLYPLKNIILLGGFTIFLTYFIFLTLWGYSPILDEYFWYIYFPSIHIFLGFLLKPFFIMSLYFTTLLTLFLKKKFQIFFVLLWSLVVCSFMTLIFSFLLRSWTNQRPFISIIFFSVFIFFLSLIVKKNYFNQKYYLYIQFFLVFILVLALLIMYSISRNSVLVILSFLFSAMICEIIVILSHYRLFVLNNLMNTKSNKK